MDEVGVEWDEAPLITPARRLDGSPTNITVGSIANTFAVGIGVALPVTMGLAVTDEFLENVRSTLDRLNGEAIR